jgi:hypothetical protein
MSQPHGTITPARPENPANPETSPQEGQYEITVPSAMDRLVQTSLVLVLEPIFEADFHPCSYGFRPRRSATQADGRHVGQRLGDAQVSRTRTAAPMMYMRIIRPGEVEHAAHDGRHDIPKRPGRKFS